MHSFGVPTRIHCTMVPTYQTTGDNFDSEIKKKTINNISNDRLHCRYVVLNFYKFCKSFQFYQ